MTLTTKIYCSRQYIRYNFHTDFDFKNNIVGTTESAILPFKSKNEVNTHTIANW
jgi:hypothetical protein